MLDVNIDAVIATLSGQREVENLTPFLVPEKGVIDINVRNGLAGYLELQVVSGAPVFLYKGANLTAKEIEALLLSPTPDFNLAAAIGQAARMQMAPNMEQITLFSEKNSIGFIRFCQYPDY